MHSDLDPEVLRMRFAQSEIGHDLRYFDVVGSTNQVASALPSGHWSTGTIVMADFQQAGRGRSGRSWQSPPGASVMMSVIFEKSDAIALGEYVMAGALSVRDAVERAAGISAELKWPNDVLVSGRKVSGILGEFSTQGGRQRVTLGIGINVTASAEFLAVLPDGATSLEVELGRAVDRTGVAMALITALNLWYRDLTHRPDAVFDAWAAALQTIGRPVVVVAGNDAWAGTALGVRRDGGLLVETDDGRVQSVYAGDVSVRH
jgi:BirA family biotin operon repressor/biotin-[acetyl-CoA-carboxylase] ligase